MLRPLLILLALASCTETPDSGFNTRGGIYGVICAPSLTQGLAGVEVFSTDGPEVLQAVTDQDGGYHFEDVATGTYSMSATKGSLTLTFDIDYTGRPITVDDHCFEAPDVHVAVIPGIYDSIGVLIARLGLPMTSVTDVQSLLNDPAAMAEYDAIFFNCGMDESIMAESFDRTAIVTNLRSFVEAGGGVYASDWAGFMAELIDPVAINFLGDEDQSYTWPRWGKEESVEATVHDADLARIFSERRPDIEFGLPGWAMIEGVGGDARALLTADVKRYLGSDTSTTETMEDRPIAVGWERGEGQVVYTTFHNEDQVTADMETILFEFILGVGSGD